MESVFSYADKVASPDVGMGAGGVGFRQHPRDEEVVQKSGQPGLGRSPRVGSLDQNVDQHLERPVHDRVTQNVPGLDRLFFVMAFVPAPQKRQLVHGPVQKEKDSVVQDNPRNDL